MLKLPIIAVRELVRSLWRRIRFGPADSAVPWCTSTMRDVLAALTDEVIMVPRPKGSAFGEDIDCIMRKIPSVSAQFIFCAPPLVWI